MTSEEFESVLSALSSLHRKYGADNSVLTESILLLLSSGIASPQEVKRLLERLETPQPLEEEQKNEPHRGNKPVHR